MPWRYRHSGWLSSSTLRCRWARASPPATRCCRGRSHIRPRRCCRKRQGRGNWLHRCPRSGSPSSSTPPAAPPPQPRPRPTPAARPRPLRPSNVSVAYVSPRRGCVRQPRPGPQAGMRTPAPGRRPMAPPRSEARSRPPEGRGPEAAPRLRSGRIGRADEEPGRPAGGARRPMAQAGPTGGRHLRASAAAAPPPPGWRRRPRGKPGPARLPRAAPTGRECDCSDLLRIPPCSHF